MENNRGPIFKSSIAALLVTVIIYSVFLLACCHYSRLTGDSTLYLSIAEKYLRGDLADAINGYWGPLLSWMLIPFLYSGASHVLAINALNLIFGILTIVGVWRLSHRFEVSELIRSVMLFGLSPILLFVSLIEPMDFLLLCVLVYYLNIVFNKAYPEKMLHGLAGGLAGALAYYAKPYGFPFFISHFILINSCHFFASPSRERRRKVMRNALAGLLVFFLLSGIWIALISDKYDHLMFSNQGRGVFASLGPGSGHDTLEKGDPIFFEGFFEPPNETAFIIYEDPSYARKNTWDPLKSERAFKYYMGNIVKNFFEGLRIYESFSRLAIAIIVANILLIFFQPSGKILSRGDLLYPLLTVLLYTGGYVPFHFETRYLWIVNILLLLMGGAVVHELFKSAFFRKNIMKHLLLAFFLLSFVITPLKASIDMGRKNLNSSMHTLGRELKRRYNISGRIASNRQKDLVSVHDSWHKTFRLSYWLNSRYYGQPREDISDVELERDLEKYGIDFYFYWGAPEHAPPLLSKFREITNGEIEGLKIYSVKEHLPYKELDK